MIDDLTMENVATQIDTIVTDTGTQQFVLVGHSLGSKIAQYFSAIAGPRVAGQILIGPLGPGRSPLAPDLVRQILDAHDNDPKWIRAMLDLLVVVRPKPELVEGWEESLRRTPRRILESTHERLIDADVTSLVERTVVPTLAIVGARDPLHTEAYTREFICTAIPQTEIIVLDCAHGIVIERPAECARHVGAFLDHVL